MTAQTAPAQQASKRSTDSGRSNDADGAVRTSLPATAGVPVGGTRPELRDGSVVLCRRIESAGTDLADANMAYRRHYPQHAVLLRAEPGTPFQYRFLAVGDERLWLRSDRVNGSWSGVAETAGRLRVMWTTDTAMVLDPGTPQMVTITPGIPCLLPAARPFVLHGGPGTVHTLDLAADTIARQFPNGDKNETSWLPAAALNRGGTRDALRTALAKSGPALMDPNLESAARTSLIGTVAGAIADAFAAPDPAPVEPGLKTSILRAKAFIRARFPNSITVADIADAAEVSTRTLQQHFQRTCCTTPLGYAQQIRLEHARQLLCAATGANSTVAAYARACGFQHLGRFSATYRAQFGENPLITLQRHPERYVPEDCY